MKAPLIDQTFADTTVNPKVVKDYLRSDPGYLELAIECGDSRYNQKLANYADFFEFHLRRYIAVQSQTLHGVFIEIRVFMAFDEQQARLLIPLLMDSVRYTLLLNEWYELMPRYEKARHRIRRKFGV